MIQNFCQWLEPFECFHDLRLVCKSWNLAINNIRFHETRFELYDIYKQCRVATFIRKEPSPFTSLLYQRIYGTSPPRLPPLPIPNEKLLCRFDASTSENIKIM